MRGIYAADVGDGLCLAVSTIFGGAMQIDCGGETPEKARDGIRRILNTFCKPTVFLLSHFHIDHYNGLLYYSFNPLSIPRFRIEEAYYPRLPEFPKRREFLSELFAINLRVFGNETGIMEYDFLEAISRINGGSSFSWKGLSKGDSINVRGSSFEILWPPRFIDGGKTPAVVEQALRDFEHALEDEETKQLYRKVTEEDNAREYLGDEMKKRTYVSNRTERSIRDEPIYQRLYPRTKGRKLPACVMKANKSLRKAANHFGLALFEDNRISFLGDAEKFELESIVSDLALKGRSMFDVLVTPHHGTHWHKSLEQIRCNYSVTSNGLKLCSKMKTGFKKIASKPLATCANGDIVLNQNLQ